MRSIMSKSFEEKRERMVESQLLPRGIKDDKVLEAMRKVPRHLFVPDNMLPHAYDDEPLPVGGGQTISQPYIVAYMTEVLQLEKKSRVLEIGTGSGYQAAILAEIAQEVYTVEIIESLSLRAQKVLEQLEYRNIQFKIGDGNLGWKENSPFDAVIVTAAPSRIPEVLQEQLMLGGKMVIPIGETFQELVLIIREKRKFKKKRLLPVRFVPLVSAH
jgi:protein-L-isoaspartate(D-aspartate) O-methyltransferase